MFLKAATARARIKNRFTLDYGGNNGLLQSVDIVLGEAERASSCEITVLDPGLKIANELLQGFIKKGGILVPKELLEAPQNSARASFSGNATGYIKALESEYGTSDLSRLTAKGKRCFDALKNPSVRAFLDAIAIAELGSGGKPLKGYGYLFGDSDKETFDPKKMNDHPRQRKTIGGLTSSATGRYQTLDIVWDDPQSGRAGLGLVDFKPISQEILAVGRLLYRQILDEVEAGRVDAAIDGNGAFSAKYEWASLEGNPYGQGTKDGKRSVFKQNYNDSLNKAQTLPPATTSIPEDAKPKAQEVIGEQIIIELGFNDNDKNVSFEYILTAVRARDDRPGITQISGKQIRYVLNQTPKQFGSYKNTSIRTLASNIVAKIGGSIEFPDSPELDKARYVLQTAENSYNLLQKLAGDAGFILRSQGTKLILSANSKKDIKYDIQESELLVGSTFGDNAASMRILEALPEIDVELDETKGIGRGFEGELNINTLIRQDILNCEPGSIIKLTSERLGDAIARSFRVYNVRHGFSNGTITSNLQIFLPVKVEPPIPDQPKENSAIAANYSNQDTNITKWLPKWKATPKRGDVIGGLPITSVFGPRSSPGGVGSTYHKGVDVGGASGTPLYIIAPPDESVQVTSIPNNGGAGNTVKFTVFGWTFRYLHLVEPGFSGLAQPGTVIGKIGSTGNSTGAHLHFDQISPSGEYIPGFAGYLYWALVGSPPPSN